MAALLSCARGERPSRPGPRRLRLGDEVGSDWADVIDLLTLHPELRRQLVGTLAEIDATTQGAGTLSARLRPDPHARPSGSFVSHRH